MHGSIILAGCPTDAMTLQTQRSVSRAAHVQPLRRPMLCSCGSTAMELAANQSETMSQSGTIQAFVKDCSVHEATAAAPCDILLKVRRIKIHLLTYSLTHIGDSVIRT